MTVQILMSGEGRAARKDTDEKRPVVRMCRGGKTVEDIAAADIKACPGKHTAAFSAQTVCTRMPGQAASGSAVIGYSIRSQQSKSLSI